MTVHLRDLTLILLVGIIAMLLVRSLKVEHEFNPLKFANEQLLLERSELINRTNTYATIIDSLNERKTATVTKYKTIKEIVKQYDTIEQRIYFNNNIGSIDSCNQLHIAFNECNDLLTLADSSNLIKDTIISSLRLANSKADTIIANDSLILADAKKQAKKDIRKAYVKGGVVGLLIGLLIP
jgi:hypothetical protein